MKLTRWWFNVRVLIVKTSSLGDVIHTLPAVTDAAHAHPGMEIDWVVEEALAEIPTWHPAVGRVIPVAMRRWRGMLRQGLKNGEIRAFLRDLRVKRYDKIIDAQGLLKSALITRLARGVRYGFDRDSAREALASYAYQHRYLIAKKQHAIERLRQLFAQALDYSLPRTAPDYGIQTPDLLDEHANYGYVVFLHGTTWATKLWPEDHWMALAQLVNAAGLAVYLPWGTAQELGRAQRIAAVASDATVLPRQTLHQVASILAGAKGLVGVDTGLAHLGAALAVPAVTIYGATSPGLTGTVGKHQQHAVAKFTCSPCGSKICTFPGNVAVTPACYQSLSPQHVWSLLQQTWVGGTESVLTVR